MSNTVSYSYDINYISQQKKILVGRNNNTIYQKFKLDNQIQDTYYFQVVSKNNQIVDLSGFDYQFFGSYIDAKQTLHVLFFSDEYTIENNVLSFKVNTYTNQYLNYVRIPRQIDLTIKKKADNLQQVILRDTGLAYPSPIIPGQEPTEVIAGFGLDINGFLISLTGTVLSGDNSTIAINDNVISYIGPTSISDLTSTDGSITITTDGTSANFSVNLMRIPDWSGVENYVAQHVPTSASQLVNDTHYISGITGGNQILITRLNEDRTNIIVQTRYNDYLRPDDVSGFAYTSAIPTGLSQLENDTNYLSSIPMYFDNEQESVNESIISFYNGFIYDSYGQIRLDADYISGRMVNKGFALTSQIPLSTSQLVDDSGFGHSNVLRIYVGGQQDNSYSCPWSSQYDCFSYWTYGSGGTIQINKMSNVTLHNDDCTTFEFWVLDLGSCTNITFENGITVIGDMPTTFPAGKRHVFVRRIVKQWGSNTEYISYAYSV